MTADQTPRTSAGHPLRLDWLDCRIAPDLAAAPGRLGLTILPGKQGESATGAPWARELGADAAMLVAAGIDTFILLVEDHELDEQQVPDFVAVMARQGIEVIRCPMVDRATPATPSARQPNLAGVSRPGDVAAFRTSLRLAADRLQAGHRIAMSCLGGLGRTGTFAACLLIDAGLDAEIAIRATRAARPSAIETAGQEAFVRAWPSPDK